MSKAEERALKAYPTSTPPSYIDGHCILKREAYVKGYEQAQKDLMVDAIETIIDGKVVKVIVIDE